MRQTIDSLTKNYGQLSSVAELYGVLIYTDEHPNIKKVLRDEDYWMSFDELSGDRFCIFSVRPAIGRYEHPKFPPGTMGFMVPIWNEPSENKELLKLFGLQNTKQLPMLLLFSKLDGEYLTIELALKDDSVDDARNSISEQIKMARSVLDNIKIENLKNPEGLFAAMSLQVDSDIKWRKLANSIELFRRLLEYKPI